MKKKVEPCYQFILSGAPQKQKQAATTTKPVDDALFQMFFPTSEAPRQREDLRQQALNQSILQKVLEEQKKATAASQSQIDKLETAGSILKKILEHQENSAEASRRKEQARQQQSYEQAIQEAVLKAIIEQQQSTSTKKEDSKKAAEEESRRKEQVRQQQSYEQAIQEAILNAIMGQKQSMSTNKEESNKPADESTRSLTSEQKETERNVTFANSSSSVYQLPQQFHAETTDEALILSIDVTGFAMDDLNLQVDPIRHGTAQLTLAAKRTNALGEVWELNQSKTLNAEKLKVDSVEATCDDNILRITIPKKVESTGSKVVIPIYPNASKREIEQKVKSQDVKPFTLQDLLEAMTADVARESEATVKNDAASKATVKSTAAEVKDKVQDEAKDEAPVALNMEDLLMAMANQFAQAYQEGNSSDANETTPKAETKEKFDDKKETKCDSNEAPAKFEAKDSNKANAKSEVKDSNKATAKSEAKKLKIKPGFLCADKAKAKSEAKKKAGDKKEIPKSNESETKKQGTPEKEHSEESETKKVTVETVNVAVESETVSKFKPDESTSTSVPILKKSASTPTVETVNDEVENEMEEHFVSESKPDESTSMTTPITQKKSDDHDLFAPETEIVFEPVDESASGTDATNKSSADPSVADVQSKQDEDSSSSESNPNSVESMAETKEVEVENDLLNEGESSDALESEASEDQQSWEHVKTNDE